MIGNYIQPKEIPVDETLSLVKYYRNYKCTLPWYQDLTVCKQVDNVDSVYDVEKLSRMYRYLSQKRRIFLAVGFKQIDEENFTFSF